MKSFAWAIVMLLVSSVMNRALVAPPDMYLIFTIGCAIAFLVGYGTGTWDTYNQPDASPASPATTAR
jgi:hypothetical protein